MPLKKGIFVEVDWMDGHEMSEIAKRKVTTRFFEQGRDIEESSLSGYWLYIDARSTPMNRRFLSTEVNFVGFTVLTRSPWCVTDNILRTCF